VARRDRTGAVVKVFMAAATHMSAWRTARNGVVVLETPEGVGGDYTRLKELWFEVEESRLALLTLPS
jgi:hypothetical protein